MSAPVDHSKRHPRLDEVSKDALWRHLSGGEHGAAMPGVQSHYLRSVLVDIHRELHARRNGATGWSEAELRAAHGDR